MHTVLIMNERTIDLFEDYRMLFDPFIASGSLSLCHWFENGKDLDSALPDLYSILQGKGEWRCIIVTAVQHLSADSEKQYFSTASKQLKENRNPFDFRRKDCCPSIFEESSEPLIRLTHILAGLPALGVKEFHKAFTYKDPELGMEKTVLESELTEELREKLFYGTDGLVCRVTFVEESYSLDDQIRYRTLARRYEMKEERPAEILLISTRTHSSEYEQESIVRHWQNNLETESSNFWQRNNYPAKCRFLCFDLVNSGHSMYVRELSTFWLAVLTVAENRLPASAFQAYRLYRLDLEINIENLGEALNEQMSRLMAVETMVAELLRQKQHHRPETDEPVLAWQEIPLILDALPGDMMSYDRTHFHLMRDRPYNESILWENSWLDDSRELKKELKRSRRSLEQAAGYTRDLCASYQFESIELDEYEQEDLSQESEILAAEIANFSAAGWFSGSALVEKLSQARLPVNKETSRRMTRRLALKSIIVFLLLFLLGFTPYLVNIAVRSPSSILPALGLVGISLFILLLVSVAAIFVFRGKIRSLVDRYNASSKRVIDTVNAELREEQHRLSTVATYVKAKTMIREARKILDRRSSLRVKLLDHRRAIRTIRQRFENWCGAFGVKIVPEPVALSHIAFNVDIAPRNNKLYRFFPDLEKRKIPFNNAGDKIEAPYDFVARLLVEREDMYSEPEDSLI